MDSHNIYAHQLVLTVRRMTDKAFDAWKHTGRNDNSCLKLLAL